MGGEKGCFLSPNRTSEKKKRILVSFMYVPTNPGRADVSFEDNQAKSCNLGAKAMQNGTVSTGSPNSRKLKRKVFFHALKPKRE